MSHVRHHASGRPRPSTLLALLVALVLGLAACSGDASDDDASRPSGDPAPATPEIQVVAQPGDGAENVAPADPVHISVTEGTIDSVALITPEGAEVEGETSDDDAAGPPRSRSATGKTYTWSGSAVDSSGAEVPITGSFTTVQPQRLLHGQLLTAGFEIGRPQLARGDTRTHRMTVIRDGKKVADYPVSYGLDTDRAGSPAVEPTW